MKLVRHQKDATGFSSDIDRQVAIMEYRGYIDRNAGFSPRQYPDGLVYVLVTPSNDDAPMGWLKN